MHSIRYILPGFAIAALRHIHLAEKREQCLYFQIQDKSSDKEKQPPFGDRKYRNTLLQKRRGYKTNGNII